MTKQLEPTEVQSLKLNIAYLQRQLEDCKQDALRYRFLRNHAQWLEPAEVPQCIIWKGNCDAQELCAEEELDTAIDSFLTQNPDFNQ